MRHKIISAVKTIAEQDRVSEEIAKERMEICKKCEYLREEHCGVCGCRVLKTRFKIVNLTIYKEKLPRNGCKHPLRGQKRNNGTTFGWSR